MSKEELKIKKSFTENISQINEKKLTDRMAETRCVIGSVKGR